MGCTRSLVLVSLCFLVACFGLSRFSYAIDDLGPVNIRGDIEGAKNVSALGVVGERLVVGSDETNGVQILSATLDGYRVKDWVSLIKDGNDAEIDIEGIGVDGNIVYVIGSHSKVRARVKPNDSYASNRAGLAKTPAINDEFRARNAVARFEIETNGSVSAPQFTSLANILDDVLPFKLFRALPSKENGVDIEGLAVKNGKLYAGFRGPVLRSNFVPILVFEFDSPAQTADIRYINLCGRGIRDLTQVEGGFLVLAGPVGDGPGSYQIYFWDGSDRVPGNDRPDEGVVKLLAELPTNDGAMAKPEGIAVLNTQSNSYEVLIAFDGLKDGGMRRYRVAKSDNLLQPTCESD